jgi:uncharacterized membrane protein
MKSFYQTQIVHLHTPSPSFLAAGIFYLIFTLSLYILIIFPSLQYDYSILKTLFLGGVFGLVTYATYDLTNQATLNNWPILVTIVDMIWGTFLSAVVSIITVSLTRVFI